MEAGADVGVGVAPWVQTVPSGDLAAVVERVAAARRRFALPATARVLCCYEAGRDGFWIHRALTARGIENRVVDSSSIEVNRRRRRAKSDRLDAQKLVILLARVCAGDRQAWSEVRVPSAADEAARHRSRERTALTQEQTRLRNQIGSWLATAGCVVSGRARQRAAWWTTVRDWADAPLPAPVQARIARAKARLALVAEQIAALDAQQLAVTRAADASSPHGRLVRLRGVATTSASVLLEEGLVWRAFKNRRQLGGLLGFAPVKYESGDGLARSRDQSGRQ